MMVGHLGLSAVLALGIATVIQAQTFTNCDPLKATCPDDPALPQSSLNVNFAGMKSLPGDLWETENQGSVTFDGEGMKIAVAKSGDSLNVVSKVYFLFGSFEFKVKSAPGMGVVSSIVLISDDRDEIDWEILGREPDKIQSNYFGKGDDSVFDRGGFHSAPANQEKYITYKIDWTPEYVAWSIDGQVVRKLAFADAKGGDRFPQSPMRIKLGGWAPGDPEKNRQGTVEWAGKIDWSKGPFVMGVSSLNVINASPGKAYVYTDKSGSYKSIKVIDGQVNSNGGAAPPPPPGPTTMAKPASPPPHPEQTSESPKESIPTGAAPTSAPDNSTLVIQTLTTSTTPSKTTSAPLKATSSAPVTSKTNAASIKSTFGYALIPAILGSALVF